MRTRKPSGRKAAGPKVMVTETFEEELLAAMPDRAADLEELRASWNDDEPPMGMVVASVLGKHVARAVDAGAWWDIHTACQFMERMATSPDVDLRNSLTVELLETLGDDRERLEKARRTMGPATLALSHEIERFWGREP
jgi:hypothetical protein